MDPSRIKLHSKHGERRGKEKQARYDASRRETAQPKVEKGLVGGLTTLATLGLLDLCRLQEDSIGARVAGSLGSHLD